MEQITEKNGALDRLKKAFEKMKALDYASSIMFWDASIGAPRSGADARSHAIGTLSGYSYELVASEQMGKDLDELTAKLDELDELDRLLVKRAKKEYDKLTKIPMEDFQAFNMLTSKASTVWEEAKEKSDFPMFQPYLEKGIDYLLKFADYRGYEGHPYNLYIDDFEEGMTVDKLNTFFDELRARLVPLLQKITSKGEDIPHDFLKAAYPIDQQDELSRNLLRTINFDDSRGMLKESVHPFTMGLDIDDVRLTTHYYEHDLASALLSTAHEGGHAVYEQNFARELQGTPLAGAASNGFHESQSRIHENNFFKSRSFMTYYFPVLKEAFPEQLKDVDVETFYRALNRVEPSLIRIEADELTYSLHIMLRYEIELGLIDGSIKVADLPEVWNSKMQSYLGITPSNDGEGVLQDVHWSEALFGYFPTYALGNAYAAQLEHYMRKDIDVDKYLEKGCFDPMTKWLNEKVHALGATKTPNELIELITGEPLNSKYYCDYLERKYSEIYGLEPVNGN